MFIQILSNSNVNKNTKTLIGVIYRHPHYSFTNFQQKLSDEILKLNNSKCSLHIAGDFNINLSKKNSDPKVSNYSNDISQLVAVH